MINGGELFMTKHERIILDKLTEDPMLSQSELASMLGLTRSSVSVYISHLMHDGYIRGRGYVLDSQKNIYIIGSSSIDYRTVMKQDAALSPNQVTIMDDYDLTVSYGGIAKNIAENMTRLGHSISCISAIGSDSLGGELLNEYQKLGVNVDDVLVVPASRSSTYLEIRSFDYNRIILASANMKLQSRLTPEFLTEKKYKLRHAKAIITEDSIPSETLRHLSSTYPLVYLICSKATRINQYKAFLSQFNGMVTNLEIASLLLQRSVPDVDNEDAVFSTAALLRKLINGPLLLCYGNNRFCYADKELITICEYNTFSKSSDLYPHYRDTVASGFFHCLLENSDSESLLKYISACRDISVQSPELSNQQLCPELVADVISGKTFRFISR